MSLALSLIPGNESYSQRALRRSENQRLAEALAARIGEHIVHDFRCRVYDIVGQEAFVYICGYGPSGHVRVDAHWLSMSLRGLNSRHQFTCQVTTRGMREVIWNSPDFVPAKELPVSEIFHIRRWVPPDE